MHHFLYIYIYIYIYIYVYICNHFWASSKHVSGFVLYVQIYRVVRWIILKCATHWFRTKNTPQSPHIIFKRSTCLKRIDLSNIGRSANRSSMLTLIVIFLLRTSICSFKAFWGPHSLSYFSIVYVYMLFQEGDDLGYEDDYPIENVKITIGDYMYPKVLIIATKRALKSIEE